MIFLGLITNMTLRIGITMLFLIAFSFWSIYKIKTVPRTEWAFLLILVGGLLNFTVFLANGGFMPSLNREYAYSIWLPMSEQTKFNWLGDRFMGLSIGDFIMFAGLLSLPFLNFQNKFWGLSYKLENWHMRLLGNSQTPSNSSNKSGGAIKKILPLSKRT